MHRTYCVTAQYPGLKEFLCGSFSLPVKASYKEVEKEAEATMLEYLPPGFVILEVKPGTLIFNGEGA